MIDLVPAILFAAVLLFIVQKAEPHVARALSLAERRLAVEERRVDVERIATVKPPLTDDDPMPKDMVEWALNETSPWAQEDMIKRMRELYDRLHDWEKVRNVLMQESGDAFDSRSTFS